MSKNAGSASPCASQQLKTFRGVKNDRLIKIVVGEGDEQQTFHLQQTLFVTTSDVFAATARHERLGNGEAGVYKFPQDPVIAWEILIYWMIKGVLPESKFEDNVKEREAQDWLVWCWVLGDKYHLPAFQDVVMLQLLYIIRDTGITTESATIATSNTPPDSKLRKLVANEIIYSVYRNHSQWITDFDDALAAPGFASDAMTALEEYRAEGLAPEICYLRKDNGGERTGEWREYMVENEPYRHWVFLE